MDAQRPNFNCLWSLIFCSKMFVFLFRFSVNAVCISKWWSTLIILSFMSYSSSKHLTQQLISRCSKFQGSLQQTLLEVRPHVFFGVPRVWEKFQEAIQSASRNLPGYKKKLSNWAQGIGLKGNYSLMNGLVQCLSLATVIKVSDGDKCS